MGNRFLFSYQVLFLFGKVKFNFAICLSFFSRSMFFSGPSISPMKKSFVFRGFSIFDEVYNLCVCVCPAGTLALFDKNLKEHAKWMSSYCWKNGCPNDFYSSLPSNIHKYIGHFVSASAQSECIVWWSYTISANEPNKTINWWNVEIFQRSKFYQHKISSADLFSD